MPRPQGIKFYEGMGGLEFKTCVLSLLGHCSQLTDCLCICMSGMPLRPMLQSSVSGARDSPHRMRPWPPFS